MRLKLGSFSQQGLHGGTALVHLPLLLDNLRLHLLQPCLHLRGFSRGRAQWHFFVEVKGRARKHWRWKQLSFCRGVTSSLIMFVEFSHHLRRKRDRHRDHDGPLALFNGLSLLVVNEGFTFNTLELMDTAREVGIAAHSGAAIRAVC